MQIERSRPILTLAGALFAATFLARAMGDEITASPARAGCAALAAEYDRKADEYAAAAERYRAWASAEGKFGSGIHESEWTFQQQAQRMDLEAERSRARAAQARGRTTSAGRDPSPTCSADRAATNG